MESANSLKITILLATFNRAHLILETLESIKNQTYTHFECLITDDNSTDETEAVVNAFIATDFRFFYFKKPKKFPQGLSATRNFGLDLAEKRKAEYIQFFDDDDIMHPQKLELQIHPFIANKNLDLTICKYRKFGIQETIEFNLDLADDNSCRIVFKDLFKAFYLNIANINSCGPLWRSGKLLKYRFDQKLYYAEEREFYLRIFFKEQISYKPVEFVLFWYRKHDQTITQNLYEDQEIKSKSEILAREKFLDFVLKEEKVPFHILKSYVNIALKNDQISMLKKLQGYLKKRWSNLDLRNIFLLGYTYVARK